jgi:hypothetical protein
MVTGTADNGGEDSTGSIVTGETGLAHTRTIVDDESSNFFFHGDRNRIKTKTTEKKKRKLKRRGRDID